MTLDNKFWKLLSSITEEPFFEQSYEFDRDPEKVAEDFNCTVVTPKPNQLQIDIDCESQYNFYRGRLNDLDSLGLLYVDDIKETPSKSGLPKRHITLTCNRNFSEAERIAIQFALGSDVLRETLNTLRLLSTEGKEAGCVFFEPIKEED